MPAEVRLAPGRVCRADRGACDVLTPAGQVRGTWGADVVAGSAHDPEAVPATGDWVVLATWPDDRATVEVILPRRAAVRRAQVARGSSFAQVLAANVDVVAVVEGLTPDPDLGRIERLLALAWTSGAEPVVVLTKVLGASGVGKSTLLNALVEDATMRTRDLWGDGKGRHTTVTRELHLLPGGGSVIDTPGLRSVGLVGHEPLEEVFRDVEHLATQCRFADCRHDVEPGCAVLDALDSGALAERRLLSYRKLQREVEYQASRTDARLRAVRAQRWKAIHLEARRHGNRP